MDLSVEISTYNRKEVLGQVLEGLTRQTVDPSSFEVIVSDDGSNDGLVALVESMAPALPYRLRVLANPRGGVGKNHNTGIRACASELVLMLAADILPEPTLVEEHVAAHQKHSSPNAMVVGRIHQSPDLPNNAFQTAFNTIVEQVFANRSGDLRMGTFLVSNISFKKRFMIERGMFKEWPFAAREDIELGYRLQKNGMVIVDNPKALGYHHHVVTLESVQWRAYSTGYHAHLLEAEMPDLSIRELSGSVTPADGLPVYARALVKSFLRRVFVNRASVTGVVVPLLRAAERTPALIPLIPLLSRKMTSYYYYRGIRDYRGGIPYDPHRANIYPSDPK